jgi:hypothetical protein
MYATAFFGKFKGTDFGTDLHEWNSMRITQKPGEVTLDMQRYIEDVIADAFPGPRRLDLLITVRPPIPGGRRPLNT